MQTQLIHVLLTEDDPVFAGMLREILGAVSGEEFKLTHCLGMKETIQRLESEKFDVILLDLNLPDSQGLDTVVRVHEHAPTVPIVVLTGTDDDSIALPAVRAGAQDYLGKASVDGRMLQRVMRHAIERKRVEETLREREEFFRLISENVNDLIAVIDRDGRRLYNSPSYKNLLGDPDAIRGTNSFAEIFPEDRERLQQIFHQTVATGVGQRTQFRFLLDGGVVRHVESQGSVIKDARGQTSKVVVVSRDITERKRSEEVLLESEKRYKHLLDSTTDYIYTVTVENGRPTSTVHGPGCVAVTGYTPAEYASDPYLWLRMVHEEDRSAVLEKGARALTGDAAPPLEHRLIHKNGSVRWVRNTPVPRKDEHGRVIAYDGLVSDITARREAEERLRNSEALYHSLVENLPQNIFRKDLEGRFTFVNTRFAKLIGQPALGKTDFDLFPKELAEKYRRDDRKVIETGQIEEAVEEHRTPTDQLIYVHVVKTPTYNAAGSITGIQGIFWDITERILAEEHLKQANQELAASREALLKALADVTKAHENLKNTQLQLMQSEKLESVGRLAAGVAHEVKNPLQIILMGVRYLSQQLKAGDENVQMVLQDIRTAVHRADSTVRGLLEFSATSHVELKEGDFNEVVESSLRLVNYELNHRGVNLVKELAENLPAVLLDRNQLEQVFINVFMNAMYAMPAGGTLTIKTRACRMLSDERPSGAGNTVHWRRGELVALAEVEDSGSGIPEDKLPKIFDPFFTTKPAGEGTGLGLSVVKNIIDLHRGTINICNRPAGGVRVTIVLTTNQKNHEQNPHTDH